MTIIFSSREWLNLFIIASLLLVSIFPGAYHLLYGPLPQFFLHESGLYETVGAISCFFAALFAFASAKLSLNLKQKLGAFWLFLFTLVCFFIAGEEISWGQHFFKFDVPDSITSNNFQKEFNIHNSMLIQSSNNSISSILFKLMMLYLILLPMFLIAFPTLKKLFNNLMIPTPSMLVAIIALLAKAADVINHKIIYGSSFKKDSLRIGEGVESVFEICLLIIAIETFFVLRKLRHQ